MMVPEIYENQDGKIIGIIVSTSPGRYEALVSKCRNWSIADGCIANRSFEQLDDARQWVTTQAEAEIVAPH
ncbi:MAG: hypothetical protein ACLGPL_01945 [Acidobacteriota bacterium]